MLPDHLKEKRLQFREWLETATDADCKQRAEEMAKQCRDVTGADALDPLLFAIAAGWLDEAVPLACDGRAYLRAVGMAKRVCRAEWWRRQLMRQSIRAMEGKEYGWGYIGKTGAYISSAGLWRMSQRKARSDAAIAAAEVISPDGEAIPLQAIIESSIANPKNKRLELVVRMKGIAEWCQRGGYVAYAVTLTAPGAFHRLRTVEDASGEKRLVDNPAWRDTSPQDTHKYLCARWAEFRALMAKADVPVIGLRTVEPHKDGTPHWHLVLFMRPNHARLLLTALRGKFLQTLGDEKGAAKRRVLIERIKPKKGQDMTYAAVAYAIGYISKNLDGKGVQGDTEAGTDAVNGAQRATAWARLWGIRQFQTFGAPSITVWRELRRVRDEVAEVLRKAAEHKSEHVAEAAKGLLAGNAAPLGRCATEAMRGGHADVLELLTIMRNINLAGWKANADAEALGECWTAADQGQFRRYMHAMKKAPVSLLKEERENTYGEPVKIIRGLVGPSGESVITHEDGWTVKWGKVKDESHRAQPGRVAAQQQPLGLVALTVTGEAGRGFQPQEYAAENPLTGGWSWGAEHAAHVEHLISEHRAGWPAHFSP